MNDNETTEQVAETNKDKLPAVAAAGAFAWDLAKRAWRIDAVKSAALTWLIRASVPGAAILVAIIDGYVGGGQ